MRKFGIKYSQLHPEHEQVKSAFIAVSRSDELETVINQWYATDSAGRRPEANRDVGPGARQALDSCEVQ